MAFTVLAVTISLAFGVCDGEGSMDSGVRSQGSDLFGEAWDVAAVQLLAEGEASHAVV